jgi:hypothetical protein
MTLRHTQGIMFTLALHKFFRTQWSVFTSGEVEALFVGVFVDFVAWLIIPVRNYQIFREPGSITFWLIP